MDFQRFPSSFHFQLLLGGILHGGATTCSRSWEVIATHLDGVSHATVTSESLRAFAKEEALSKLRIPAQGETIELTA